MKPQSVFVRYLAYLYGDFVSYFLSAAQCHLSLITQRLYWMFLPKCVGHCQWNTATYVSHFLIHWAMLMSTSSAKLNKTPPVLWHPLKLGDHPPILQYFSRPCCVVTDAWEQFARSCHFVMLLARCWRELALCCHKQDTVSLHQGDGRLLPFQDTSEQQRIFRMVPYGLRQNNTDLFSCSFYV